MREDHAHEVTFIPGDGTGPELAEATRRVLEATGVEFTWDEHPGRRGRLSRGGQPRSPTARWIRSSAPGSGSRGRPRRRSARAFARVNVLLRKELDLYACIRPCKAYEGVRTRFPETDIVIVRENTEDLYAGIEFEKDSERRRAAARVHLRARRARSIREHSGISDQADLRLRLRADRARRVRLRARQRPQEGDGRPQGQHHEVLRRAVPRGRRARSPRTTTTSSSRTASSTTCAISSCRGRRSTTSSCSPTSTATSCPTSAPA